MKLIENLYHQRRIMLILLRHHHNINNNKKIMREKDPLKNLAEKSENGRLADAFSSH
jgi:hypothetical protein